MKKPYGTLPGGASTNPAVWPFTIDIPEAEVERMQTLVKLSPVASACFENSAPDGDTDLGLSREWLVEAKRVWETDIDWKALENEMNSFPHFKATVSVPEISLPMKIHFMGMLSENPQATPIVLIHGWPGSFREFLPMLSLLRDQYPDPAQLPYHIIVPSLPGYAFSDAFPNDRDHGIVDAARVIDALAVQALGFRNYVVQGGDIGSRVSRILCAQYAECKAALLNFSPVPPPPSSDDAVGNSLNEAERRGLARADWFRSEGCAYALEQATRPATVGLVLSSSPLALLAWIGEKFLEWTDPASYPVDGVLPAGPTGREDATTNNKTNKRYSTRLMRDILASVSLYWLTGRAHTCLYSYRETFAIRGTPASSHGSPEYHVAPPKKLGFSSFPMEVMPTPRAWVAASGNLVFSRSHAKGGHFAAMEQPAAVLQDLVDFVSLVLSSR
ncbi:Alpha/Beta hydrolase protein [Podospora didyma]|uniref:Alpha/Beta hydrolase protein n=1 Tax=Podospora didyma TaxID=330526 RepID=A0AAE0N9R1_9PEZI|nr:Alpha/Beta hydrolase protein [Podospora didyma]